MVLGNMSSGDTVVPMEVDLVAKGKKGKSKGKQNGKDKGQGKTKAMETTLTGTMEAGISRMVLPKTGIVLSGPNVSPKARASPRTSPSLTEKARFVQFRIKILSRTHNPSRNQTHQQHTTHSKHSLNR